MKKIVMIFSVLFVSLLWGMEKANKDWFIAALDYRMKSKDPIVLCFQKVKDDDDDTSEIAMLNTVRKGIQDVAKADLQAMKSSISRSLGIALSDETKKAYAHEMNNGWIALCINMPYVNGGWMTVQKYYVSSKKWESGKEIHCGLPQGCIYRDLENSDMIVLNIPDNDNESINSCYTLIRSLQKKGIPLLVNSDRRLLKDLWNNLDDLFPEKEDIKVFSNVLLGDSDSDDTDGHSAAKTFSGRSESDDIFPYDDDSHNHHKLDSKEDSVDSLTQSEDSSEVSGDTVQNDNNGDDNNESTTEDIFPQTPSDTAEDIFAETPSDTVRPVVLKEEENIKKEEYVTISKNVFYVVQPTELEKKEDVKNIADTVRGNVVTENEDGSCFIF